MNLLSYATLKASNTYPDTNLLSYVTLKAANTYPDTNPLPYVILKAANTHPNTNLLCYIKGCKHTSWHESFVLCNIKGFKHISWHKSFVLCNIKGCKHTPWHKSFVLCNIKGFKHISWHKSFVLCNIKGCKHISWHKSFVLCNIKGCKHISWHKSFIFCCIKGCKNTPSHQLPRRSAHLRCLLTSLTDVAALCTMGASSSSSNSAGRDTCKQWRWGWSSSETNLCFHNTIFTSIFSSRHEIPDRLQFHLCQPTQLQHWHWNLYWDGSSFTWHQPCNKQTALKDTKNALWKDSVTHSQSHATRAQCVCSRAENSKINKQGS